MLYIIYGYMLCLEAHSPNWKQWLILWRMEGASSQGGDQQKPWPLYFLKWKYTNFFKLYEFLVLRIFYSRPHLPEETQTERFSDWGEHPPAPHLGQSLSPLVSAAGLAPEWLIGCSCTGSHPDQLSRPQGRAGVGGWVASAKRLPEALVRSWAEPRATPSTPPPWAPTDKTSCDAGPLDWQNKNFIICLKEGKN